MEAGLAALRWVAAGYGYEITGADVWSAYSHTMRAAASLGEAERIRKTIRTLVTAETPGARFVAQPKRWGG